MKVKGNGTDGLVVRQRWPSGAEVLRRPFTDLCAFSLGPRLGLRHGLHRLRG